MKTKLSLLTLVFLATSAFAQDYNHHNLKIMEVAPVSDMAEATPAKFEMRYAADRLRLYPILASDTFIQQTRELGKFTLLKDAIETNKIKITETGAGDNQGVGVSQNFSDVSGTVNTLVAANNSTDTIFIMAGEVVKGGKQDRVIGQDIVLLPGEEVNLSAFCVEASRWTTTNNNGGQFTDYFNVSSMDIRETVVTNQNQQMVWSAVDGHTAANNATSETKTYTNLENSEEYQAKLKLYLDNLTNVFNGNERVVGVIAVTGDRVMGLDIFATHELFISSYPNLLHSYANEAITHGADVTISNEAVYNYLDTLLSAEANQEQLIEENGSVYKYRNFKLHCAKF